MPYSARRDLYYKIEILREQIINSAPINCHEKLIWKGGHYYWLLPKYFTIVIIVSFIFYKFCSDNIFFIDWIGDIYYCHHDFSAAASEFFLVLNVVIIFDSISACFTKWDGSSPHLKEIVDELKNLITLTENPSKESFVKNLDMLQNLLIEEKLTDFEIVSLIELLDILIIWYR